MSQRLVNVQNKTVEITNPELELDKGQTRFDGQTYQFSINARDKKVVPDGMAVRENLKVDNATSTIVSADTVEARS